MKKIELITTNKALIKRKRVAAYARVSSSKETMLISLEEQIRVYKDMILSNPKYDFAGIYIDEGLSGVKENRPQFQRMLDDCKQGKIDMIITKSISRFARNTVTLLQTVRMLKSLNVDVYFETNNIHTLSEIGEYMLTILALCAQEESFQTSERCKWRIRNKFKDGYAYSITMLGYDFKDNNLVINQDEAKIVRIIFDKYLSGYGMQSISNYLNQNGYVSKRNGRFYVSSIRKILTNEKYAGDLLLQKYFVPNHRIKTSQLNHGELPMYYVKNAHEPIIDRESFDKVQKLYKQRRYETPTTNGRKTVYPLTGMIKCGICGKNYKRKIVAKGSKYEKIVWVCSTYDYEGKHKCNSKKIPQDILYSKLCEVLHIKIFDEKIFKKQIKQVLIPDKETFTFVFVNGKTVSVKWENASRKWSEEQKELARIRQLLYLSTIKDKAGLKKCQEK